MCTNEFKATGEAADVCENAHSKKVENHAHAIALYFMHYNYCKIHTTLRVRPAMEAGLTDHVWEIEELLALLD
jgi:hypothetical protein